jgi:CRP-like cAMP-binding protein
MSEAVGLTIQRLLRKINFLGPGDGSFGQALTALCTDRTHFSRGDLIVSSGQAYERIYLIEEGWALRYKLLGSGMRQVTNYATASDFLCFNAALFRDADHYIVAKTELVAFTLPIRPFLHILNDKPEIAMALAWANAQEEAVLAERLASLGRRNAKQRLAHLFCELWRRLDRLDLADSEGFELPLTQDDLADTLGLSLVHVNRTLGELSRDGLLSFRHQRVRLLDRAGLDRVAGFDDTYLRDQPER